MPEIRKRKPLVRDASLTLHLRRRFGGAGGEHRRRGRGRAELWML